MNRSIYSTIEKHLQFLKNPIQYVGGEFNSVHKSHNGKIRIAFAFPDTYNIGMSSYCTQIMYEILNRDPDIVCERTFHPWIDMEEILRSERIPLFTLESHTPLKEFDIVGFTLQHELSYTSVLNMLALAGITIYSEKRDINEPLIVAGGPCAFAPEPMANFIDAFIIGDGEDVFPQFSHLFYSLKQKNFSKEKILHQIASQMKCVYVPSLYEVSYDENNAFKSITPKFKDIPPQIEKNVFNLQLQKDSFPIKPLVPLTKIVQDRIYTELMRGCPHRCRFCQSTVIKSPLRIRTKDDVVKIASCNFENTGLEDISLASLSSGNYPHLADVINALHDKYKRYGVGINLPSLRVDDRLKLIPRMIKEVRKSGFTIAPEAGTERLRKIIRKPIREADIIETAISAFSEGWRLIKLYFMIGLPGETEEDLLGIAEISQKVSSAGKSILRRPAEVNVTISPFVPKPHTPFQWAQFGPIDYIYKSFDIISKNVNRRFVKLKLHSPQRSLIETVLARGDRRTGKIIYEAFKNGARLEGWDEFFNFKIWEDLFAKYHIDGLIREIPLDAHLPWEHIKSGVTNEYLKSEWQNANDL